MNVAAQQFTSFGQVLLAVRAVFLVRRAQQLQNGDQIPILAVTDLQEQVLFKLNGGNANALWACVPGNDKPGGLRS